jgi:hypothetical protein
LGRWLGARAPAALHSRTSLWVTRQGKLMRAAHIMASRAVMLRSVLEAAEESGSRDRGETGVCRGNASISTPSRPWREVASSRTEEAKRRFSRLLRSGQVQEKWSVCTLFPCSWVEADYSWSMDNRRWAGSAAPVSRRNRKPTTKPYRVQWRRAANTRGPAQHSETRRSDWSEEALGWHRRDG